MFYFKYCIVIPSAPEIHEQYEEVLVVSEEDSLDHDGILIFNEPSSYNSNYLTVIDSLYSISCKQIIIFIL